MTSANVVSLTGGVGRVGVGHLRTVTIVPPLSIEHLFPFAGATAGNLGRGDGRQCEPSRAPAVKGRPAGAELRSPLTVRARGLVRCHLPPAVAQDQ
jgi:hypothetical protein